MCTCFARWASVCHERPGQVGSQRTAVVQIQRPLAAEEVLEAHGSGKATRFLVKDLAARPGRCRRE